MVIILTEKFEVREIDGKGKGLFAINGFKKGEHIFHNDLTSLPSYTLEELHNHPDFEKYHDHSDYVGNSKYVIDLSSVSFMNHSCDSNCVIKMKTEKISDYYALKTIKPGEELTHDYTLTSIDQFDGKGFWILDCKCGSENCRGKVTGDFFKLDKKIQKKYYKNLPPEILDEYKDKITEFLSDDE